ncbi:hypothetical protein TRIUR3_14831 [Triticum urartu]|uniref:DUF1618 domain-containing protein n=1 Tax=Triticum urartu TaxID=4572 RepID=M7YUT1_TRIUA|nr:hypothetical protein TRIUR3_14831 [Triticum urartu]
MALRLRSALSAAASGRPLRHRALSAVGTNLLPSSSFPWPSQRPPPFSSATHADLLLSRRHTSDILATYIVFLISGCSDICHLLRLRRHIPVTAAIPRIFLGRHTTQSSIAHTASLCRASAASSPRHHDLCATTFAADSRRIDKALIPIIGTNLVRRRTPNSLQRPLSGELFRLPDIDGTKETLCDNRLGLLTKARRGHGPPDSDRPELRFVELPEGKERVAPDPRTLCRYRRVGISERRLRYAVVSQCDPLVLRSFALNGDDDWTLEHEVALSPLWTNGGYPWLPMEETPRIGVIDPMNASIMHLTIGNYVVTVDMDTGKVVASVIVSAAHQLGLIMTDGGFFRAFLLSPWLGSSRIPRAVVAMYGLVYYSYHDLKNFRNCHLLTLDSCHVALRKHGKKAVAMYPSKDMANDSLGVGEWENGQSWEMGNRNEKGTSRPLHQNDAYTATFISE